MSLKPLEILLVEDNPADADWLQETLAEAHTDPFKLVHVERLDAGMPYLARGSTAVILLDLMLPDASGLETVQRTHAAAPQTPIVVLTGLSDEALVVRAVREGAQDYLVKGQMDGSLLVRALRYAMERQQADNEIRQLNQELAQHVHQLTAANQDLAAFDYSISHDLRGPLTLVAGFARLLMEEYVDKLDAEGRHMLNVIRNNAQKMNELINDLLAFSGLGQRKVEPVTIDMNDLARSAWEEVQRYTPPHQGQIVMDLRSQVVGDRAMLRQVWINLLSNAIKFTRRKETTVIEIGDRIEDGQIVYYVKDNGEGFDMEQAHKLFGAFQRLHTQEEFPGTGVGLAIVERIIHRHGGRVWADGKIHEGATFYFSMPMKVGGQA